MTVNTDFEDFKSVVDQTIDKLRIEFNRVDVVLLPVRAQCTDDKTPRGGSNETRDERGIRLNVALESFITSKQKDKIRPLTVDQLKQRISHFIDSTSVNLVNRVTSSHAMVYRDLLLNQGRSFKTNKDYLAAVSQFMKWCRLMRYHQENPFEDVKLRSQELSGDDSPRLRWQHDEIKTLVNSAAYKDKDDEFKWVTLLMLYHGCRPAEACQLRVIDIKREKGIWCINITDAGIKQRLKNRHSKRLVPIHQYLINSGFIAFVDHVKCNKSVQLFTYRPDNKNEDWSRQYCQQLGRLQTKIGMKAAERPTAYSFRHTFIDELKQMEIDENIASQIVGHKLKKITYGRYGKKYPVSLLENKLNTVQYNKDENIEKA